MAVQMLTSSIHSVVFVALHFDVDRRAFTGGPVRNARGHTGRGAGAARPAKAPKKPKTAEDLDKELDAYLGEGDADMAPTAGQETSASAAPAQDVDMA